MSAEDAQQEIIDEFLALSDWQDRYRKLIQVGRALPPLPQEHKLEDHLVKGCQNRVWLHARREPEGTITYLADSEAMIVRGFVALLMRIYSGRTPDEILATEPRFIHELELGQHISLSRTNGLASMIKQIRLYAMAFKSMAAAATPS